MTPFKTVLISAAILALPCAAAAQIPSGLTDKVKEKAVDQVIENATPEDAITGGKVIFKGGSKEDAAIAIVKNRAEKKVDGIVGDRIDGITSGEAPSSSKVYDQAKGSATTYGADKVKDAGSATTYSDPAAPAATTTLPPVNCPAGTTAQPNGTCMVTGNWGG